MDSAKLSIEWTKSEVTTYRHTFDLNDMGLNADGVAELLAAIHRGDSPDKLADLISDDLLPDYEESGNEYRYDGTRGINKVTVVE